MHKKPPTIKDVARVAGVSVGSASNVLNNTHPASDVLKEKVLNAAEQLGFSVNSIAQTLRRKRSGTIGFCTTTVATVYLRSLADELDEIATIHGYELVQVLSHQDPEQELKRVQNLIGRQVDGLILLPTLQPQRALDFIAAAGKPAVVVDRVVDDPRFNSVAFDNRSVTRDVVEGVLRNGHRRILFIAQNLSVVTTQHRIQGLSDVAAQTGPVQFSFEAIQQTLDQNAFILELADIFRCDDPPTAIITGNSKVAIATIQALKTLGIEWPKTVSLATFDDPDWAPLLPTALSTVLSPVSEMAKIAWKCLSAEIQDNNSDRAVHWLESKFVARDSICSVSPVILS